MFGFKRNPAKDPTALLNLLCRFGWINEEQKAEALALRGDRMVGQVLIDLGTIVRGQLDHALLQQQIARGEVKRKDAPHAIAEQVAREQDKAIEAANKLNDAASSKKIAPIKRER